MHLAQDVIANHSMKAHLMLMIAFGKFELNPDSFIRLRLKSFSFSLFLLALSPFAFSFCLL